MLRTHDLGPGPRTALLSCLGKCGVAARIGALANQPVVVTGSLIQRGRHSMIAVDEGGDWIRHDDQAAADPGLRFGARESLGEARLAGEILDSKCWFGAMRPSVGKVHKSCASLCIRGGIPPAFYARGPGQQSQLLIMTDGGRACGPELLALIADPVRAQGRIYREADLLYFDVSVPTIQRV